MRPKLPKFPLPALLRATTVVKHDSLEAPNVVGLLPGSDANLKGEYVVLSAHLDHLGVGRPVNGDSIYNGAMDDASGVATILEVARMMKESGAKPSAKNASAVRAAKLRPSGTPLKPHAVTRVGIPVRIVTGHP